MNTIQKKDKKGFNMFLIIFCLLFIIFFSIFSETCIPAAAKAVNQFLTIIIPSLFPFFVASDLLKKSDFCKILSRLTSKFTKVLFKISGESSLAIIIGYICGYPAGAKITSDLYKEGKITYEDAVRLSVFTNNTGPLFLIGSVGVGMLGSAKDGITLLLIHISSSVITGIVLNHIISSKNINRTYCPILFDLSKENKLHARKINFAEEISESITSSIYTMLPIGASVIFFAAFTEALLSLGTANIICSLFNIESFIPQVSAGIKSIFEITGGIAAFSECVSDIRILKIIISTACGLAGISVHFQVLGIYGKAGIPASYYFFGKQTQAAIAVAIAACV